MPDATEVVRVTLRECKLARAGLHPLWDKGKKDYHYQLQSPSSTVL